MAGMFSRLFGGSGSVNSAWKPVLAQLQAAGMSNLDAAAQELPIPLGVLPGRFVDNLAYLETQGMGSLMSSDTRQLNTTPTIVSFRRTIDRPPRQPKWFLAAFPDAADWVSKNSRSSEFDARLKMLMAANGVRDGDDEGADRLFHAPDGTLSPKFCRMLVDWYVGATGRKLETTN